MKIFLADALKEMKKPGSRFSLAVREYNRQTKTGGKLKRYSNVELVQAKAFDTDPVKKLQRAPVGFRKDPKHWKNRTRNIRLADGRIKKINILLITEFNGKKVVY